ncbi:Uncharacterized protein LEKG_1051 [Leuconostoc gasicomitatum KG16-1]|nr:Uncharacterized protein LEKG_1051 [Leuconostoc gasicomitatum KG16-1]
MNTITMKLIGRYILKFLNDTFVIAGIFHDLPLCNDFNTNPMNK